MLIAGTELVTLALTVRPNPQPGLHLVVTLLWCGPIVLLRRWPLPVLAVTTAGTGLVMASGQLPLVFGIMLGLAMYFAAAGLPGGCRSLLPWRRRGPGRGAHLRGRHGRTAPLAVRAMEGFVPLGAAWFVGDSVAARRRYVAGLAEQAQREQAAEAERARQQVREERVRIAHELHDVVAHTLAVITVQAGVGRRLMAKRPEEASAALESIETIGRTAQDELRVVLGLLRDEEAERLRWRRRPADRRQGTRRERPGLGDPGRAADVRHRPPLSPALELSLYRVIQEALTNVVKHAPGARATST